MQQLNWSNPVKICLTLIRYIGLWPKSYDDKKKLNIYTFYSVLILGIFVFLDFVSELIMFYSIFDNLKTFVYQISIFPFRAVGMVKSCVFIFNLKSIQNITEAIKSNIFQPSTDKEEEIFVKSINQWKNLRLATWIFGGGAVVIYVLSPLLDKDRTRNLLYAAWYPYNTNETPLYEITLCYQALSLSLHACLNTNSDLYFSALNLFIGCQYEFLCNQLRILDFRNKAAIIRCIEHHKRIIKLHLFH